MAQSQQKEIHTWDVAGEGQMIRTNQNMEDAHDAQTAPLTNKL